MWEVVITTKTLRLMYMRKFIISMSAFRTKFCWVRKEKWNTINRYDKLQRLWNYCYCCRYFLKSSFWPLVAEHAKIRPKCSTRQAKTTRNFNITIRNVQPVKACIARASFNDWYRQVSEKAHFTSRRLTSFPFPSSLQSRYWFVNLLHALYVL
jgi:hypothetical protein